LVWHRGDYFANFGECLEMIADCPCCKGKGGRQQLSLFDDRFGYPGEFGLLRCEVCGHQYICGDLPESPSELYTTRYSRSDADIQSFRPHNRRSGFVTWLNGGMSSSFRWVPENVRVLDLGCGLGEAVAYHKLRGCDARGVDADHNVMRIGELYSLDVRVGTFESSMYESGYFDYVTLDQVIEHVHDPVATLKEVAEVLRENGVCVLSTPNAGGLGRYMFGRKWLHWHVPYHVGFFSRESMRKAAAQAGLTVHKMVTVTRSEWILYQMIHLMVYPAKGVASSFWVDTGRSKALALLVRSVLLFRFTMLPQLVTRILDFVGVGDNYLVVLKKDAGRNGL
jgi:2-polyprenyl-3-methyl-5-hydroxy-6-metoxy-1,4-benzoquinol methylase